MFTCSSNHTQNQNTERNGKHLSFMYSRCFKQAQNLLSVAPNIKSFLPRIIHTTSDPPLHPSLLTLRFSMSPNTALPALLIANLQG